MYVDAPANQYSIVTEEKGSQEEGSEYTMLIFEFVGQGVEAVSCCLREGRRRAEELDPRLGSE